MNSRAFTAFDHEMMAYALRLAEHGLHSTTPNPRVGCVLAKAGRVIATGWHEYSGGAHAETRALDNAAQAGEEVRNATAYVTLEPCNHQGVTAPCTEALVQAGVSRVVIAVRDPNPEAAGGIERLQAAGIECDFGLLAEAAREINIGFFSRIERKRPWIRLKLASSLDGAIALNNGVSQWITGAQSRQDGHRWRARACAILTGVGTVCHDDPQLTVRGLSMTRQPLRVIVDSKLRVPLSSKILKKTNPDEKILVVGAHHYADQRMALHEMGVETLILPDANGRVDLAALMHELAIKGVNELHVESGRKLSGVFLLSGLVDEILLYMGMSIMGDKTVGLFDLPELKVMQERFELKLRDTRQIGDDLRLLLRPV